MVPEGCALCLPGSGVPNGTYGGLVRYVYRLGGEGRCVLLPVQERQMDEADGGVK